jgi:hypothetical protein
MLPVKGSTVVDRCHTDKPIIAKKALYADTLSFIRGLSFQIDGPSKYPAEPRHWKNPRRVGNPTPRLRNCAGRPGNGSGSLQSSEGNTRMNNNVS